LTPRSEHVCNWLFEVKAGVITSLNRDDFDRYNRIFIFNPIQGGLRGEGSDPRTADSEADRYLFMRRNIPRSRNTEPVFASKHLELFHLEEPPQEWVFGQDGRWRGYGR
jgi:hypothetical protein